MSKRALALAVICGASTFGCAEQPRDPAGDNQEIIENLIEAGFPESDIMIADDKVYVGRDAEVSLTASREMLVADDYNPTSRPHQQPVSRTWSPLRQCSVPAGSRALNRAITNTTSANFEMNGGRVTYSGCTRSSRPSGSGTAERRPRRRAAIPPHHIARA